jgi:Rap1a immunity proteins
LIGANGKYPNKIPVREVKMLRLTCAFLILTSPVANAGQFYSYPQWAALDETHRAAYIAGVFDALLGLVRDETDLPVTKHYDNCITRANMTNGELADKVIAFVKTRPDLQRRSVSGALINYLVTFCGPPPLR